MKKRLTLAGLALSLALTLTLPVSPQSKEDGPGQSFCGMEEAMARMPFEQKMLMSSASVSSLQVGELLLYINFNPDGSVVRPGFGNADALTSSIVNQTHFCPAPQLSEEQKEEIVRLVSDEFSPFNIRLTTDPAEFAAYPRANKQMALITTSPSAAGFPSGFAGVSPYAGIGNRLPGDFVFVFASEMNNDTPNVAATISHEFGHIMGLGHQHRFTETCGFNSEYHGGTGTGPLGFVPLMGLAYRPQVINNWFAQSCPSPTEGRSQNDYNLLNSQVVVRSDDFPDERTGDLVQATTITGYLERAGDVDYIKINFRNPGPVIVTSGNIDLKVSVFNSGGRLFGEYNDVESPDVFLPSVNDKRYLKIEAAGNDNMSAQFMTGTYRIEY